LSRTENDGGNSWKRLRSSPGLARDDDDDDDGGGGKSINKRAINTTTTKSRVSVAVAADQNPD